MANKTATIPCPECSGKGSGLFVVAKASVLKRGMLFSIGTKGMSQTMANMYRVGYWLMFTGCLLTFVK